MVVGEVEEGEVGERVYGSWHLLDLVVAQVAALHRPDGGEAERQFCEQVVAEVEALQTHEFGEVGVYGLDGVAL